MFGIFKNKDTSASIINQLRGLQSKLDSKIEALEVAQLKCKMDTIEAGYSYMTDVNDAQVVMDEAIQQARGNYNNMVAIAKSSREIHNADIATKFIQIDDELIEAQSWKK